MKNNILIFLLFFLGVNLAYGQSSPLILIQFGSVPVKSNYLVSEIDTVTKINLVNLDLTISSEFTILSGVVMIAGGPALGNIQAGGVLDYICIAYLKQSKGKDIYIEIKFTDTTGVVFQSTFSIPVK